MLADMQTRSKVGSIGAAFGWKGWDRGPGVEGGGRGGKAYMRWDDLSAHGIQQLQEGLLPLLSLSASSGEGIVQGCQASQEDHSLLVSQPNCTTESWSEQMTKPQPLVSQMHA